MKHKHLLPLSALWLLTSGITSAIVDINDNGISDLFERQYNNDELFPETFDPQDDADGDGWTNAEEAAAGTDPFSPQAPEGLIRPAVAHYPAVMGEENGQPVVITPEAITVTWPTIAGKQYTIRASVDLEEGNWLPIGEPFIATGAEVTYGFETGQSPKCFYRVAVTDVDTDGDSLTDAEENELGTEPGDSDSDGNGTVDADEFDFDKDGLIGKLDAAPKDGVIAWKKTRPTRYALFDVPMDFDQEGYPVWPVDVNSQGMVLFHDGIDWNGTFDPLVDPTNGVASQAIAINDHGTILGTAA